jgi:hypothetical protein
MMGTAWLMVSFQQTSNALLNNLTPFLFHEDADHLLGQHVWGLVSTSAEGIVASPSWPLLLHYEQEIRNQAYFLMEQGGVPLVDALRKAWMDDNVKGYFSSPRLHCSTVSGLILLPP